MKQKYLIFKDDEKNKLVVREFAELDKEMYSLLCEELYDDDVIKSSIAKSKACLISALRTQNMYPSGLYADKIAESVIAIYNSAENQSTELFFDDIDLLTIDQKKPEVVEDNKKESIEIDKLLEDEDEDKDKDDFDDDFDDDFEGQIKKNNHSIKVAEEILDDSEKKLEV